MGIVFINIENLYIMRCWMPLSRVLFILQFSSVQSLSRVRLCDPMNRSTPGLPVHHKLPEYTSLEEDKRF